MHLHTETQYDKISAKAWSEDDTKDKTPVR